MLTQRLTKKLSKIESERRHYRLMTFQLCWHPVTPSIKDWQ